MHMIQRTAELNGFETRSYSGRSMFGSGCLGIDIERGQLPELLAALIENLPGDDQFGHAAHELAAAMRGMRVDSMGRGEIVYFVGVSFTICGGGEELEEDEEEDGEGYELTDFERARAAGEGDSPTFTEQLELDCIGVEG